MSVGFVGTDTLKPLSVMETRQHSIRSANSAPHGRVPDFIELERDELWFDRHPALAFCLSMILSENRIPLFRIML